MKRKIRIAIISCIFIVVIAAVFFVVNESDLKNSIVDDSNKNSKLVNGKDDIDPNKFLNNLNQKGYEAVANQLKHETEKNKVEGEKSIAEIDSILSKTEKNKVERDRRMALLNKYRDKSMPPEVLQQELQRLSAADRKAVLDSIEKEITQYDANFDLESVIEQSPYLQHLRQIREQKAKQTARDIADRESQLAEIQEHRTFILNEAKKRGAILVYDDSGNAIDYEKDEQGNPILRAPTQDTLKSDTEGIPQQNSTATAPEQVAKNNLKSQVAGLWINASKQYPEALFAPHLTQEEFAAFYPTQEARQSLEKRKKQMQNHIVSQVQSILSSKTFGSRKETLPIVREALSENFDKDFTDAVMRQLSTKKD